MAKFVYRMQSILNIKEKMEEQARMEFAQARIRLTEEEERLAYLTDRKDAYVSRGRELQEDSLNVLDIMENRDAIALMKEFIEEQKREVAKAERQLEEARLKLQNAMQESKTHERLREKAFEEFVKEINAQEAKEIDELTSYVYGQKE